MSRYRTVALLIVVLLLAASQDPVANPIPDETVQTFNHLIAAVAQGATQVERDQLIGLVGQYGLHLASPETVEMIRDHFPRFASILIESQQPPHAPRHDVQRHFRRWERPEDVEAMNVALRRWLTEPVTEAPSDGGMRVDGPGRAAERSIMRARVAAAEILSDDGDETMVPLVEALLESPPFRVDDPWTRDFDEYRRLLRQARVRVEDPAAAAILLPDDHRGIRVCREWSQVDSMRVWRRREGKDVHVVLDRATACELFSHFGESLRGADTNWRGSHRRLEVWFRDGAFCTLSPTEVNRLAYEDNTRLERWHMDLLNRDLFEAVLAVADTYERNPDGRLARSDEAPGP